MKKIFTILISIISLTSFGQNWNEVIKAVASDRATEDNFGYHVIIDGNRAVVSSNLEDEDSSGGATLQNSGSVYVFELSNGAWLETAKLVASDRAADDNFGSRVSISGDRIIVGAYLEDEDALGANTLSEAGSAYIFELSGGTWTETAKLVASDRAAGYRFGFDVTINDEKAIIGSYYNATDTSGVNLRVSAGAAYIFELSGGVWTETTKLVASDRAAYNYFGYSVDMDESIVIVGAHGNLGSAGAAYVFELNAGVWTETTKLTASDGGTNDNFGISTAIDNNRILVGAFRDDENALGVNTLLDAGSAYIFELIGSVWTETTKLSAADRTANDNFGFCVDISENNIIIGARNQSSDDSGGNILTNAGSAYIFEYIAGVWTETTKLTASDREDDDNFGTSVSISGNKAIVGSQFEDENATGGDSINDAGSVYIYMTCSSTIPSVTVSGDTLSAPTSDGSYQWIDCDNGNAIIPSETNQTYTATESGNYAVVITNYFCVDTSACVAIVVEDTTNVGINDLYLDNTAFQLFPNPAKNQVTISNFHANIDNISIMDVTGKMRQSFTPETALIDVSMLQTGIYFIKIEQEGKIFTQKLVKH